MSDILLLQYHDSRITGAFTTILDAYVNLSKYMDIDLKTVWGLTTHDARRYLKNNNFFGTRAVAESLTFESSFERETIICTSKLLADLTYTYLMRRKVQYHCKNLIVLDSFDLAKTGFNILPNLDSYVKADNCVFLCNPANFAYTKYPKYEYYHKFNKERLDSQVTIANKYNYKRSSKQEIRVIKGGYFENIGKRIFEYIYHGHPVRYRTDGMFMKDGLYYYLKLFGVDAFKNHNPLKIKKAEVVDKLFMKEDDILLDILN